MERNAGMRRVAAALVLWGLATGALASKEPWEEYEKIAGQAQEVSPHGPTVFGDSINLQNGALSFSATDVSLRGNNALRVEITRTFATKTRSHFSHGLPGSGRNLLDAPMGDWEIDLPNIGGVFALSTGWNTVAGKRCTITNANLAGAQSVIVGTQTFQGHEIWQGTRINLPGRGSKALQLRTQTLPQPSGQTAYWITSDWTSVSCLSSTANGTGEGFLAMDSDGNKYRFDWMAVASEQQLAKPRLPPYHTGYEILDRGHYALYATRVEDRFGNWVTYTYSNAANAPVKLDSIESSDGRVITLTYTSGRVSSVSAHGRSWSYGYNSTDGSLTSVTLPDSSTWTIDLTDFQNLLIEYEQPGDPNDPWHACDDPGAIVSHTYVGTVKHPSGATGTFTVKPTRFVKDGIDFETNCFTADPDTTNDDTAFYPMAWDSFAVTSKSVSGPGLAQATWNYAYAVGRSTVVTGPSEYAKYTYGNVFHSNEGKLLKVERGASASQILSVQDLGYELAQSGQAFPTPIGQTGHRKDPDFGEEYLRPQKQSVFTRQGQTFSNVVNTFDSFARPLSVTRSSNSTGSPSRTEVSEYLDNTTKWVLGQRKKLTVNSVVAEETTFDTTYALPLTIKSFGKLQRTLGYDTASSITSGQLGTVKTLADGKGNTTTATSWKRGIPQSLAYADASTESAVIDDLGQMMSWTDENGYKTCYAYDGMGRLSQITRPSEASPGTCNTSSWNATTIAFVPVASAEYGLPAGHWRQTISTGDARKITYFDAFWRPRMAREYDNADETNTRTMVLRHFDIENRKTFESYPQRTIASIADTPAGITTSYDALGRVTGTVAGSELGNLTTTTVYQSGFKTQIIDARANATTTTYAAFDDPDQAFVVSVAAPEGASVGITRDTFGDPTQITRSGSFGGGTVSASRQYIYDANRRLCKTIEPESGATLVDYDGANNILWRAVGTTLTTLTCDRSSAPAARKISHTYDGRNRLLTTTYGDSSPSITRTWFPDGQPKTVASNGTTWTYAFNTRRLVKQEKLVYGGTTWTTDRAYNANGHPSTLTYPGPGTRLAVSYAPNALGQPTQVGSYATAITYHPGGQVSGFTFGNGIAHTLTLNTRALPLQNRDVGVLRDVYTYDQNGNVTVIDDQQENLTDRALAYDNLDRLKTASGIWGSGSFTYDPLDNIRTSTIGSRSLTHNYASANRLTSLSGSQSVAFSYDANGNITGKGSQTFTFDIGNRLTGSSAGGGYVYDGEGRRVAMEGNDGSVRRYVYSKEGQLLWGTISGGSFGTSNTAYVYLAGKQIAEVKYPTGSSAGTVTYLHADGLGSPVARTSDTGGVLTRTRYEPYGKTAAGTDPSPSTSIVGFTGHVNELETSLVYMQQRYYDPLAGRFLSVDPIVTDRNTGLPFGRYHYAANSPYRFTDPHGDETFDCTGSSSCASEIKIADLKDGDVVKTDGATVTVGKEKITVSLNKGFENGSSAAKTGPIITPSGPPGVSAKANSNEARKMGPLEFRDHVKNRGAWDYKQQGAKYEPFGNYNYGVTGRAAGFPTGILLQEAGRAQVAGGNTDPKFGQPGIRGLPFTGTGSFGDDPVDQFWIQQGIRTYDSW